MKEKDWFKIKSYTHITPKIPISQKKWISQYVKDEKNIESHRFFPMIHYTIVENKYKRQRTEGKKDKLRTHKSKQREIFYSNHLDGHILSYYSYQLNELLNIHYLSDIALTESVIAYRSIPYNNKRNKCNIDFANDVFTYIKNSKSTSLSAICIDVSSYFDTINHLLLKKTWAKLLGRIDLPKDHYKVYRSITKYSYIEIGNIFKITQNAKINKLSHLRQKSIDGFFKNGSEFRKLIDGKNIIRVNKNDFGIPQGSPISAVLSNLYLVEFDKLMVKLAKAYQGLYKRYSDDIVFVCDPQWIEKVDQTIKDFLIDELKLTIQEEKTQRVDFTRENENESWNTTLNEGGIKYKGRPLTYLGFDFDGQVIRIKQKSISSYYRKTKRFIRRAAHFANKTKESQEKGLSMNKDPWIYRSKLYRLKTHLGARKKSIDNKIFWGNYLSYAYNAAKIMGEPGIKKQTRNHWRIVNKSIDNFNKKYDLVNSLPKNKV
jgi:hypothetical protein